MTDRSIRTQLANVRLYIHRVALAVAEARPREQIDALIRDGLEQIRIAERLADANPSAEVIHG